MRHITIRFFVISALAIGHPSLAKEIDTNGVRMPGAPAWLTSSRVETAVGRAQSALEWDTRKVTALWYASPEAFAAVHKLGAGVLAFYRRDDGTIHIGPEVTTANFDSVFTHEMVHVILHQKYKGAVPAWLEEGLANHIGRMGEPDYRWLSMQPAHDVTTLAHPFGAGENPRFHYEASTALIEMIRSRCSLPDLLQLSVGKKLETYLSTYCEIADVNEAYRTYVARRAAEIVPAKVPPRPAPAPRKVATKRRPRRK